MTADKLRISCAWACVFTACSLDKDCDNNSVFGQQLEKEQNNSFENFPNGFFF